MLESDDITLLKQYAEGNDSAFTALAERYVNLVFSTALRQTYNPSHAEEITQAVFIILSQKAKSISPKVILSGWLYQTTRLTAANFLRSESRRQRREQEAYMDSLLNEPTPDVWRQVAPLLDDAMGRLSEKDRELIVLRYFENKSAVEIGDALRISAPTAQKRLTRAVDDLRKFFVKQGVSHSAGMIAGAISAHSVQAAPPGLALSAVAAVKGTTLTVSTPTLVKGTLKLMAWTKLKFALGMSVAILIAGGAVTIAISQINPGPQSLTPQEIVKKSQAAYAALSSYSDEGKVLEEIGSMNMTTTFNIRLQRPDLYRVEWSQATGFFTNGGIVWSAGNGDFLMFKHGQFNATPAKYRDMETALGAATGVSGQASATIPETFFNQNQGNALGKINSAKFALQRLKDGKVGNVDCFVLSTVIDSAKLPNGGKLPDNAGKVGKTTTTLWIGKQDDFIHQSQTIMEGTSITPPQMNDSQIKAILDKPGHPATAEDIAAMRTQLVAANKMAQSMMSSGKFVFTQTHENISVNRNFSVAELSQ